MKLKTVITLYIVLAALAIGVFIAKAIQNAETDSSTKFTRGYKPFEKLAPGEITEVELKGADHTTTVKIEGDKWVVAERDNYPANVGNLQSLLRALNGLTVSQSLEAGESFDPRFGMDETSSRVDTHGTILTLKKADGSEVTRLKLGKNIESGEQQDAMAMMMGGGPTASGKFIRLQEDVDSVYVVTETLNEANPHPKEWLKGDFIKVLNPTSITLSPAGNLGQADWKATRADSTSDFTIEGAVPAGKEVDGGALNALKNVLGFAQFDDVVSAPAAEGLMDKSLTRRVTITTQEGFTYTLDLTPKKAEGTENYLMTVKVSAKLQTERAKPEGEDADIAKQADADFAKQLEEQKAKLAAEQALQGRVYEVTSYTVQALLKTREELFKAPAPAGAPQGQPQFAPGSATTPPFQFGQ